jgi:hypothetical protein
MERERRRTPRYQFIVPAELVDETSGRRMNSWVADLGSQGCSLSVNNPPRAGAAVQLKIGANPRDTVQAKAVVVHSTSSHAGVMFTEVKPNSSAVLQAWLATAKFPKS